MNIPETGLLLAMIAASDRRTVGDVDIEVWHDALTDLAFTDCRDAVRQHIRSSRDWLTPYDVRQTVKAIRADRLARTVDAVPDADPDQPADYLQALREGRVRVADGAQPRDMRALPGTFPSPPPVDWRPQLPAKQTSHVRVLPPVDDPARLEQARAELAAMTPIPIPEPEAAP